MRAVGRAALGDQAVQLAALHRDVGRLGDGLPGGAVVQGEVEAVAAPVSFAAGKAFRADEEAGADTADEGAGRFGEGRHALPAFAQVVGAPEAFQLGGHPQAAPPGSCGASPLREGGWVKEEALAGAAAVEVAVDEEGQLALQEGGAVVVGDGEAAVAVRVAQAAGDEEPRGARGVKGHGDRTGFAQVILADVVDEAHPFLIGIIETVDPSDVGAAVHHRWIGRVEDEARDVAAAPDGQVAVAVWNLLNGSSPFQLDSSNVAVIITHRAAAGKHRKYFFAIICRIGEQTQGLPRLIW